MLTSPPWKDACRCPERSGTPLVRLWSVGHSDNRNTQTSHKFWWSLFGLVLHWDACMEGLGVRPLLGQQGQIFDVRFFVPDNWWLQHICRVPSFINFYWSIWFCMSWGNLTRVVPVGADPVCGGRPSRLTCQLPTTWHTNHQLIQNDTIKSQTGHPKTTQWECNTSKMSTSAMLWGT